MRTRQRSIILASKSWAGNSNITITTTACNGSRTTGTGSLGAYSVPTARIDEYMTDNPKGKGRSNGVWHRKQIYSLNTSGAEFITPSNNPIGYATWSGAVQQWTNTFNGRMAYYNTWNLTEGSLGVAPVRWNIPKSADNESSLVEDCYERARGLKADVLLNVVEANQMWPSIKSLATALPVMAKFWPAMRKGSGLWRPPQLTHDLARILKSHAKTASGAYLAWKFGLAPVLSDIGNIIKYAPKLQADIKRHADQSEQRFTAKAEIIASFDSSTRVLSSFNGIDHTIMDQVGSFLKRPEVRYVLVVKPKVAYEIKVFQTLDTLMRRFTTSPASLAWEKVPFSFVIDWFVDLRGAARAVDNMLGIEPWQIIGFTRSHSYQVMTVPIHEYKNACNGASLGRYPVGDIEYSHYERSKVSTSPTLATWKPRFGKNQAGISAALIMQQLTKLRAKRS